MVRRSFLAILLFAAGSEPAAAFETWQDIRFRSIKRQGLDFSCGAASLVALAASTDGRTFEETVLLADFIAGLAEEKTEDLTQNGLTLADLATIAERIGYRSVAVRIGLLDLARAGRPAIVYIERDSLRHFVIFDRLAGEMVELRDPSLGFRRLRADEFAQIWKGQTAFFLIGPDEKPGIPVEPDRRSTRNPASDSLLARMAGRAP